MPPPPRVTVAIAFHNEEQHLGAAIHSILNQTYRDFELLLIDDGSTDASLGIAQTFLSDVRVRLLSDGVRRHLAARLNESTRLANGELFARMDGDDVVHPTRLELQVAHLDRERTCEAVGTHAGVVDENEHAFAVVKSPTPNRRSGGTRARSILEWGMIPHATMVGRTAWLRQYPYDETLTRAEDRDLWCRIGPLARIDTLEEVLYVIRTDTNRPHFLADYLKGHADLRRVLWRHGPSLAGPIATASMLVQSHAKSVVMRFAHAVGLSKRIIVRRGGEPTRSEQLRIEEALASSRDVMR